MGSRLSQPAFPEEEKTFSKVLTQYMYDNGLLAAELSVRALMNEDRVRRLLKGSGKVPRKKELVQLSLACQLSVDEAEYLMSTANFALSPLNRLDQMYLWLIDFYNSGNREPSSDERWLEDANNKLKEYGFGDETLLG